MSSVQDWLFEVRINRKPFTNTLRPGGSLIKIIGSVIVKSQQQRHNTQEKCNIRLSPRHQRCAGNVLVQDLLKQVMHWHFVLLPAFFVESQPPERNGGSWPIDSQDRWRDRTELESNPTVESAVSTPWSNGPVEGHINRLKILKRQMYGRAGIELLRARLLPEPEFSDP
jgi:hypothetical protein